jgi:hypothetical protein
MILVYSVKGGYMNCYNAREVKLAAGKGYKVVKPKVVKPKVVKAPSPKRKQVVKK